MRRAFNLLVLAVPSKEGAMAAEPVVQEQELRSEALTVQQRAASIVITDQPSYDAAVQFLGDVKGFRKRWWAYWNPLKESAYHSYKGILDRFKEGDDPADVVERQVKRALLDFDDKQRREQERLQAEAQRKAEEEEAARRAQLAFEMEDAGAEEAQIEEVVSAPVVVVAEAVAPTYQKASGVSRRDNWKARVTDVKKLCKTIGAGKLKFEPADEKKIAEFFAGLLKDRAAADKSTLSIAGVEAYNDPVIAGRF
jgi:hypothetical protein